MMLRALSWRRPDSVRCRRSKGLLLSQGNHGACLGPGETVWSSMDKRVSEDAACFDSYQCNYGGFTCKSNVTECIDE